MARLEIRLFGRLDVRYAGEPWTWSAPPRAAALLAYVVVHAGEAVSRAALATLTWPDDPEDEARGKLRRHLHRITRALPTPAPGAPPWLEVTASTVRWNANAACWVDVADFEAGSAKGKAARAIELYRGEFLEDAHDDWVAVERERYRSRFLELCYDAALQARRDRNFEEAIRYADRMLAADEWREDAVRLAMAARYEAGDRSEALACFERFTTRLRSEMKVEPMPETLVLHAAILGRAPVEPPAAPFVGRSEEGAVLEAAWVKAARGRGTAVFVGGESGIGKSRLVAELGARVTAQGGRWIAGRTSSPQAYAYEPIVDALRRSVPLIECSRIDRTWLSALQPLLPELGDRGSPLPALDREAERARLFEAIARVVEALARTRSLLLAIEDAHDASPETLEAIESLARRIGGLPVLLLVTYRTENVGPDHPLGGLRRNLQSERRATGMTLYGLQRGDVDKIAEAACTSPPAALVERVHALSEGNPLFVNRLLESYRRTGAIPDARDAAQSVGDAILARLQPLDERERTLARAAATIGRSFSVEAVSRAVGWSEADTIDAIGALLDRGLVRESGETALSYAFNHALIAAAFSTHRETRTARRSS